MLKNLFLESNAHGYVVNAVLVRTTLRRTDLFSYVAVRERNIVGLVNERIEAFWDSQHGCWRYLRTTTKTNVDTNNLTGLSSEKFIAAGRLILR